MKLKSILILAPVFAAIAATGSVRADSVDVSNQALTIALTTKAQAPGTFEVDPDTGTKTPAFESQVDTLDNDGNVLKSVSTTATKAVTAKYGNKELLESIKDDLLDGTVSGWSLVVSAEGSVMAVKKDQDDVPLDDIIGIGETPDIEFSTSVDTTINKYDSEGSLTSSENKKTAKGSTEGLFSFTVLGSDVIGSMVAPFTSMAYYPDPEDKSSQELAIIPGAGKITGLIGEVEMTDANDNTVNAIIGGTVTMAAAKGTLVKD